MDPAASSRRRTTWDSRDSEPELSAASSLIRSVRPGASDSEASTKYSKWLIAAVRCMSASNVTLWTKIAPVLVPLAAVVAWVASAPTPF